MKIVLISSYGPPWLSGLINYVEGVARYLVEQGHSVHWICSDEGGEKSESESCVLQMHRITPLFRFGRGVFIGHGLFRFLSLIRSADLVVPVLPFPEAGLVRLIAPRSKLRPIYVCRPNLDKPSAVGALLLTAVNLSHWTVLQASRAIAVLSLDYGQNIPHLKSFWGRLRALPPLFPEIMQAAQLSTVTESLGSPRPIIGFVGRPTFEKGIPVLFEAFQLLSKTHADVELHLVGPQAASADVDALTPALAQLDGETRERVKIRGQLSAADLDLFYRSISLLALPSTDSLEAFGMVQVEAMLRGTPVVASALPGVRLPISVTQMGILCPPGNAAEVARAFQTVLENRDRFIQPVEKVREALLPILSAELIDQFVASS